MMEQEPGPPYVEQGPTSESERDPVGFMENKAVSCQPAIISPDGSLVLPCDSVQKELPMSLSSEEDGLRTQEYSHEEKENIGLVQEGGHQEPHCDLNEGLQVTEEEKPPDALAFTQDSAQDEAGSDQGLLGCMPVDSEQRLSGGIELGHSDRRDSTCTEVVDLEYALSKVNETGGIEEKSSGSEIGDADQESFSGTEVGNLEQVPIGVLEDGEHEKFTEHGDLEERSQEVSEEQSVEATVDTESTPVDLEDGSTKDSMDNTLEDSGDFPSIPSVVVGEASEDSPPATPAQRDEDITAEGWRTRRKHIFVLSEAGKPIYSRYGNEEALSSTMGVMMALVSFVQSGNNSIRSIHSDNQKVVFLQQGPLVLVSVSRTPQSEEQLRLELQYVYYQIISMLTQASVARIFERKKNYDLRRLLTGSEKILDSLLDLLETDPGFLLRAVRCLPLPSPLRDSLSSILTKAITTNLVFSILVADQQLVTVVQEKAVIEDCRLDPADLHLLLNLIGASSAFQAGEIWTPICLPRFNPDGYFYAYISYLDPECTVCLVLLSTDKESFYAVSACKKKIQEAMEAQNSLQALAGALRCGSYSASLVGVPELLHFVYKPLDIPDSYQQLPQFTSPEAEGPYASEEERQRLFDLYRYLHCRIHSSARPLRLIYHVAERETLLAWVTSKFELYTAFSSLVTKVGAINVITKLLRWIKKEEDRLFIRYPPKYSTTPLPGKSTKAGRPDRTDASQNGYF